MTAVTYLRAQTRNTQFIYELYSQPSVQAGHGIHHPIPGPRWREIIQGLYEGWQHIYVVYLGSVPVGHIGLQDWSAEDRRAELSFAIHPSVQNQKIGQRALTEFVEEVCVKELTLACLWARTPAYNTASRRLMDSIGMKQTGELKEYYRYKGARHSQLIYTRTR